MSSLDMSLDDISKASRGSRGGSRGGRGGRGGSRNGAPQQQQQQGPMRNKQRHSGGGASTPRQQQPYARAPLSTPLQYAQPIYAAPQAANGQWKRDLYASPEAPQQQQQQQQQSEPVKKLSGDTIHVSNLASDVSDDDVREIFQRIGKVTSCVVNFNSSGKSTGTATVTFARKQDAEKAVEDYDEAEVDGRPMKLKLVGTVVTAPVVVKKQRPVVQQVQQQQPLQPQLAYLPQQLFAQQPLQFAQSYQPRPAKQQQQQAPTRGGSSRGGRGGAASSKGDRAPRGDAPAGSTRGGRGGARGGRGGKSAPQEVSSADLDKEMDSYHQTREAAVAAATPAAAGQPTTV